MPAFSDAIIELGSHLINKRAAADQGGIISGDNPTHYNTSNPIRLWIIQAVIIIGFTQILSIGLKKLRQPRVIAEVIGGILLGPTVMGRIPNFSNTIFPKDSLPFLSLIATIGLVLFLFLVGMEIDPSTLKRNMRASAGVSAAGMILPFGLGVAIAVPIYKTFIDQSVNFGHFLLFVGVAIAITAFPVLCRILTETRLLDTDVGVVVLSAGVGNDVVGWILLALVVALVNASSGLTALWVLLASAAFVIFLLFPVKWAFHWLARKTGSLENGTPTTFMMTMTLLLVFASAFFTDVIGVHAIFGGFLAGLLIPHERGFAIAITEKLEDLVSILFLPLYFTLSGLKTNLGLLDDGKAWGYVVLVCTVAFFGKFLGCAATAKFSGFSNRESTAIGCLMSCKGLVELIVLNIGLQAGILDTRVFSIFVLHAVVLTCLTTPLTLWAYPAHLRRRVGETGEKAEGTDGEETASTDKSGSLQGIKTRFTVVLPRMESLPAVMALVQFLQPPLKSIEPTNEKSRERAVTDDGTPKVSIDALRLIELTERTSAVMKSTIAEDIMARDSVLSVFRTFGHLNRIPISSTLSILQLDEFSAGVAAHARHTSSDMILIPWNAGVLTNDSSNMGSSYNPFETIFGKNPVQDKAASVQFAQFVRRVFADSPSDVALYFDREVLSPIHNPGVFGQHIFLPFFGGPDDRLALAFVVQLCTHPAITATVIKVTKTEAVVGEAELSTPPTQDSVGDAKADGVNNLTVHSVSGFPDTLYPGATTQTRAQSGMADNIQWEKYTRMTSELDSQRSPAIKAALGRITFGELASSSPLGSIIEKATGEAKLAKEQSKSLLVVVGRARRLAVESHTAELRAMSNQQGTSAVGAEVRKTLGDVGSAIVMSPAVKASLLVIQSSESSPASA